ncbi:hypothetical protein PGT21_016463 [Puccinia graminis f. sp. tritici]|uniref:Uncharacterized protein n=1 Tax=Puccinia graminis f. sp. tritici TaxID=56615 RepID=A0A5B0RUQ7_PUCGR|nr:hypothetical protein PGT21_018390 [Puccinia graminis f. sp. tritici]KAA1093415.1 hypothetical protein PGTUg99_010528 [Puccinia graminis f. sp. tritici]KAA1111934.1 hypothetical protein PGT21_016463 [Puccinia graminis f. sp. tritici]KAA1129691.1 hypothetical protein PGTUg99_034498 [Puccinia graminis f. sp. tritici]
MVIWMVRSWKLAEAEQQDDATLALDLRIRLLECVFAGALPSSDAFTNRLSSEAASKKSLALRLERVLGQLTTILGTKPNEAIRRFVQSYDLNEPLLHLPNPLSSNKEAEPLSISEKASLVFEADAEIVQLERDLREIELLDNRGFVGAGKLADGDWSEEELVTSVIGPLQESKTTIDELEQRATTLMSRYDSYVNSLSEIFVSWDSILTTLEEDIHKLQIAKAS